MCKLAVILGSKSDGEVLVESGAVDLLNEMLGEDAWSLSFLSAHRHPDELRELVQKRVDEGTKVFIGAAGLKCDLPGAIAAHAGDVPIVIGVPLPTEPHGRDKAILDLTDFPPGIEVAVVGDGKRGLMHAAALACRIIAMEDGPPDEVAVRWMQWRAKQADERPPEPEVDIAALVDEVEAKKGGTA